MSACSRSTVRLQSSLIQLTPRQCRLARRPDLISVLQKRLTQRDARQLPGVTAVAATYLADACIHVHISLQEQQLWFDAARSAWTL
jgi:hypothetical protein